MNQAEQLAEALERVRELEDALRPLTVPFYRGIDLTVEQALMLESLCLAKGPLSISSLRVRVNLAKNIDRDRSDPAIEQAVYRLRTKLSRIDIPIHRERGSGFYIDQDSRDRLALRRRG